MFFILFLFWFCLGKVARATACVDTLAELNPYVEVKASVGELSPEYLQSFGAVIVTKHLPKTELLRINAICRSRVIRGVAAPVTFILALNYGVTCFLFSDFGDEHVVTDADGETVDPMVVESIDEFGVVTVATENHGLSDGDYVSFSECEGAEFLNQLDRVRVRKVYTKQADLDADGKQRVDSKGKPRWRNISSFNKFQLDLSEDADISAVLDNKSYQNASTSQNGYVTFQRDSNGDLVRVQVNRLSRWRNGGLVTYIKPKRVMNFKSLEEAFVNPLTENEFMLSHLDDERTWMNRGGLLHLAFNAYLEFEAKHNRVPALHNEDDAKACVAIANALNEARGDKKYDQVDAEVITKFTLFAGAELTGFAAFLGGAVAQEVVKKFGKYTPIHQWVTSDYFELLPNGVPKDALPIGSRYDHQISVFGKAIQDKICAQKWFLVGCGALGCEYIKSFAMMGLGASPQGLVHITDMDRIELSNLSRQFLFRSEHINQPKSRCAALVAQGMNPDLNVVCHETKVADETEHIFNDAFWTSLDGVWNALDNIHARLYTDKKCILYGKPLLESGTEGTKANSSVHIPGKTLSYGDVPVQETGKIAACTLRNFPHLIVHCIEWARPRFESLFTFLAKQVNALLQDEKKFFANTLKEGVSDGIKSMTEMKDLIILAKKRDITAAMQLATNEFILQYRNRIKDLTYCFPEDARNFRVDEETGEKLDLGPFWTGKKRFPTAVTLDLQDENHLNYLFNATNLYAFMFGIPSIEKSAFVDTYIKANVSIPAWEPPKETVDVSEEQDKKIDEVDDEDAFNAVKAELSALVAGGLAELQVADFEKDDDTNFHIDFIHACSNMRAWNYKIQPCSRLKAKVIAGKIIAALASTTAMITGLASLEFYKLVLGLEKDEKVNPYFDTNVNLAVAAFHAFATQDAKKTETGFSELMQCDVKAVPEGWTTWDFVTVDEGDLTWNELIAKFPSIHHEVEIEVITKYGITAEEAKEGKGVSLCDALNPAWTGGNRKISEVYQEVYGEVPQGRNFLLLTGDFALEDEPVNIPPIRYIFRH